MTSIDPQNDIKTHKITTIDEQNDVFSPEKLHLYTHKTTLLDPQNDFLAKLGHNCVKISILFGVLGLSGLLSLLGLLSH